jgi:transcriptional regulator with XRE-family HTH domain
MTHLGKALGALSRDRSLRSIAAAAGIAPSTITRLTTGARPDIITLRTLCTTQQDPRDGLDLLLAHLRDEVERSGRLQTEVRISGDDRPVEDDLRLLVEEAHRDEELRGLLVQLAGFIRSHPIPLIYPEPLAKLLAVAEPSVKKTPRRPVPPVPKPGATGS